MVNNESLKTYMGKLKYLAYLNRRRTAVETLKRAVLQFQETRALLGSSDSEECARKELDVIINSLSRAIPSDLQHAPAVSETPSGSVSQQIA